MAFTFLKSTYKYGIIMGLGFSASNVGEVKNLDDVFYSVLFFAKNKWLLLLFFVKSKSLLVLFFVKSKSLLVLFFAKSKSH